jgi:hypothetical protein
MGETPSNESRISKKLAVWLAVATSVVGLATGVLALKDQIFPGDQGETDAAATGNGTRAIPRFKGVAGHFDQSEALLDFLAQHDGEPVKLLVSFRVPEEDFSGEFASVNSVRMYTSCQPLATGEQPNGAKCTGTNLVVVGPTNGDALAGVAHGAPVLDGYFKVDLTRHVDMGLEALALEPLTLEQASGR